jgi:transposase InsO family protein
MACKHFWAALEHAQGKFERIVLSTNASMITRDAAARPRDLVNYVDVTMDGPRRQHDAIPTGEGTVYCAAVMAVYSRRIIGQSIDLRQETRLVVDAMTMAVVRRDPRDDETILHSDHGCQYTAMAYGKRLRESGLLGSMGTVGDCYDNAMMVE